jgi:ABC-type polysaccharide/polyol phosphate export permease
MRQSIRVAGRDHIGTAFRIPDFVISLANLWHRRELLWNMTVRHLRGQYKQSILGYAWALLMPLTQMIIMTFVFSTIIKIQIDSRAPFAVWLFVGLLPWNFFSSSLSSGTDSVMGAASLVTKVYFPREILPAAAILTKVVDLAFSSTILVALMVYYGYGTTETALWIPALFLNLFFHDVRYLVGVALTFWFYITPIIFPLSIVPSKYQFLFDINPMSLFVTAYRRVLLEDQNPDLEKTLLGLGIAVCTCLVGYYLFKKMEPGFADRI